MSETIRPLSEVDTGLQDWPAGVHICQTGRFHGGHARGERGDFDMGHRDGEEGLGSEANRQMVQTHFAWPVAPLWLRQVHGKAVVQAEQVTAEASSPRADAVWTAQAGRPVAVQTADCLPVVLVSADAQRVGVAHAGWRGLVAGVIEALAAQMRAEGGWAWLGPAISQAAFEVGPEVRQAFVAEDVAAQRAFIAGQGDRWHADLYALARLRLQACGLTRVGGGEHCTVHDARWFSHRRQQGRAGRMATLVWR